MSKEKSPEDRAKLRNFRDVIRDEIYGAAVKKCDGWHEGGDPVIVIKTKHVAKIAKRVSHRWLIGPR